MEAKDEKEITLSVIEQGIPQADQLVKEILHARAIQRL